MFSEVIETMRNYGFKYISERNYFRGNGLLVSMEAFQHCKTKQEILMVIELLLNPGGFHSNYYNWFHDYD